MTYKRFEEYMTKIVSLINFQDDLDEVIMNWNKEQDKDYPSSLYMPTLIPEVIMLLEELMQDKDEWISYWVYELDCGRAWREGIITENGKDIPLKTIQDLWNILSET